MTSASKLLAAAAFCVFAQSAAAQSEPLKMIVPWPAGGVVDNLARIIQPKLSENLGQAVVVENRAGATGTIGTAAGARSRPDGNTLVVASPGPMVISSIFNPKLAYKPTTDFAPVSMGVHISNVLVVHPASPITSVSDLIATARARPGKMAFASSGNGSTLHLSGELMKMLARVDIQHVPYKGSAPALSDVMGGQIDMAFSDPSALALVKAGKLRALAQSAARRSTSMPDIPSLAEAGVAGFNVVNWCAFFAPAGTPEAMVGRLNAALARTLSDPEIRDRLLAVGMESAPSTPQFLDKFLRDEFTLWQRVITTANIKPE